MNLDELNFDFIAKEGCDWEIYFNWTEKIRYTKIGKKGFQTILTSLIVKYKLVIEIGFLHY